MAENRPGLFQYDRDGETSPRRLAVLIGAGVIALLLLLWLFRDPGPSPDTATADNPTQVSAPPVAQRASVAESTAAQQPSVPVGSVAELRLHGVMGMGDSGAAIISTGAGPQRLVRVGREVLPGVPLLAVAGDHVLLRENGREIRLAFSEDASSQDSGGASIASANDVSRQPGGRNSPEVRRAAREYQTALAPVQIDGRHAGYRFRADRMPAVFRDAGITPEDIVMRVGGLGLEDADAVAGIPERLSERGDVEVEIIRDGEQQTIVVNAR